MSEAVTPGADVTLGEAVELLRACRTARLLIHRNPDGDCVGSATALAAALAHGGREVTIVSPDPLPAYLHVIPGAPTIITELSGDPDLLVIVDVSDPALLSPLRVSAPGFLGARRSLNVDHHFSNLRYARYNYVDATAASAAEIVHALIVGLGAPINAATATDLLYGIVNDTHSFQNSNTTPRTLRLAGDLVELGANLSEISFELLIARRAASARLWALVLPTLRLAENERVAFMAVTLDALRSAGAELTDADGLVEFLKSIRGVDLAVLCKQTGQDTFRLSLRTTARVDATVVAGAFGGGGHQRAAGCDARGDLRTIQQRVLAAYAATRGA